MIIIIDGYYEVSEIAKEWGVTNRSVQQMCSKGRIPGARKIGRTWCIPVGVSKPEDERVIAGNYREARRKARGEITQSAKDKVRFIETMSQDIRSSLNAIMGYSDIVRRNMDDKEKLSECLDNIQTSGNYINNLLNNVLEYVRLDAGMTSLEEEVVSNEKIISQAIQLMQGDIDKKQLELSVVSDVKHEFVYADREKHIQILGNVISNSIRFTKNGGCISIHVSERESRIAGMCLHEYGIEDTGIGMNDIVVNNLFASFSKSQPGDYKTGGCGLGMTIVKKLLNLMKGNIKVSSIPDKGTKVTITIPHKIADISEYGLDDTVVNMEDLKGKRILLAEDNDFNCEVAIDILTEAGFEVECAKDGIICVAMLEMKPVGYYDMILMDIAMPHVDGIKATKLIRSLRDKDKSEIPIIAMTANVTPREKEYSLKAGMNGFIGKPMEIVSLCKMIQSVLSNNN